MVAYFSTIFAEYVAYPIEVVRRRRVLINSKESFLKYAMKIWQKEGAKGFYRGAAVVPVQSVMWSLILLLFDTKGVNFQTEVLR